MTSSSPAIPTTQTLQFDADSLEQLIAACPLPDWVAEKRRKALTAAAGLGLPDRRSENWMRTDLRLFKPAQWGSQNGQWRSEQYQKKAECFSTYASDDGSRCERNDPIPWTSFSRLFTFGPRLLGLLAQDHPRRV